ncbi:MULTISPECIES: hypothetical protein [unclassified Psychrobacter]|uniref:hypothetical protein n=1 Tax=unclassified Psychrobacter TaxID=196806 RepID=UPI00071E94B5|nr:MULTISPECIES: hypothetical protein [unclassified Psychrobacter]OLF39251.1 hypothetical protein BTV98_02290 [Psychrobacter sp. Cmf 22.2]
MDIKDIFKKEVEKQLLDVEDYIFTPERIDMAIDNGELNCVLNSDGSVNIFYTKEGITDVRAAARKHPFTAFKTELHHGIYDDVIEDLIDGVNDIISSHSKYFRPSRVLPMGASLGNDAVITDADKY